MLAEGKFIESYKLEINPRCRRRHPQSANSSRSSNKENSCQKQSTTMQGEPKGPPNFFLRFCNISRLPSVFRVK